MLARSGGAVAASIDDALLARAAAQGDREAFEELVRLHGPGMLRFARRLLSDRGDAEDAVQDAFVAAWRGLARFRGESSVRTWLLGLTSHKAVDIARRRRPSPVARSELVGLPTGLVGRGDGDPWQAVSATELAEALDVELKRLPYRQRACWTLVELEGLSQPEVARVLHLTPDAVRGRLERARRTLEDRMARWRV